MSIVEKEKRQPAKKICYKYWAIPEKKTKQREGGSGFVDIEFPGILKKEQVEIPAADKLEVEFSKLTPVLPVLTIPELTQSLNFLRNENQCLRK